MLQDVAKGVGGRTSPLAANHDQVLVGQVEPCPVEGVLAQARRDDVFCRDPSERQVSFQGCVFQEWRHGVVWWEILVVFQVSAQTKHAIHGLQLHSTASLEEPLPPGVLALAIQDMVW